MDLSAVRIFVDDLAAAEAFYSRALGLTLTHADPETGYCVFDTRGIRFVVEVASSADAEARALVGRLTGLSFEVNHIDDEYKRLKSLGVSFHGEPERQSWGGWLVGFSDPAGNQMRLVEYPG